MKKLITVLLIVVLILCAWVGWQAWRQVFRPFQAYAGSLTLQIPPGEPVSVTAERLERHGVISSRTWFLVYYRLFHRGTVFKTGEYRFTRPLTMKQVIFKLHQGQVVLHKVTVTEGLTLTETADVVCAQLDIDRKAFLETAKDPAPIRDLDAEANDLEGYLYPDTYHVPATLDAPAMVSLMVEHFRQRFNRTLEWRSHEMKLTVRQVVTLASLIEKETADRSERFLISSVFHNRLRIGMPLACDPTIIYALKRDGKWRGKLGWAELKYDSPFNTRLNAGLPPGPICSPGIASIEAALYPESTNFLYFVSKDGRTHHFSRTLQEHNRAVRKYILDK